MERRGGQIKNYVKMGPFGYTCEVPHTYITEQDSTVGSYSKRQRKERYCPERQEKEEEEEEV